MDLKDKTIDDITEALQLMEQIRGLHHALLITSENDCYSPVISRHHCRIYGINRGDRLASILQMWVEQHGQKEKEHGTI